MCDVLEEPTSDILLFRVCEVYDDNSREWMHLIDVGITGQLAEDLPLSKFT
jgi:hypothetical protein